jgi:signal transduction histidine kinase
MYRTTLIATFLGLLALALGCTGLALYGARLAGWQLERTHLAHEVLEAHLELEAQTYLVFKQLTDAYLTGSDDRTDGAAARDRLVGLFDAIRTGIAREVAFVGDREDEAEELVRLAEIERKVQRVIDNLDLAVRTFRAERMGADLPTLDEVLEREIDQELRALIDAAIAEEKREVVEAREAAEVVLGRVKWLSLLAAAAALALCGWALTVLLRRLLAPLAALEAGAAAVARGELAHRVAIAGQDEFARLGAGFNRMVEQLAASRLEADAARAGLERAVAERTAELAAANASLRAADEARRRFLADVSHELRTPLTVVRGEAEVTLRTREAGPEDYRRALQRIVEQVSLTAGLVDDLLFVARNEGGVPRLQVKPAALTELVRRACADADVLAAKRSVTIEYVEQVAEAVVQGDPTRLRQLVMILLDNAIRYSEPHGVVRVVLGTGPAGVVLQVIDRGIGIPEADLATVFERFYRGRDASRLHSGGSGLGLALAKAIVEAHGGEITIDSRPGEGTTVGVVLPAAPRLRAVS